MERIDGQYYLTDDIMKKVNELVEEYNKMKANLKAMSYYNELDKRLKRLEVIEVKRMLDNK